MIKLGTSPYFIIPPIKKPSPSKSSFCFLALDIIHTLDTGICLATSSPSMPPSDTPSIYGSLSFICAMIFVAYETIVSSLSYTGQGTCNSSAPGMLMLPNTLWSAPSTLIQYIFFRYDLWLCMHKELRVRQGRKSSKQQVP